MKLSLRRLTPVLFPVAAFLFGFSVFAQTVTGGALPMPPVATGWPGWLSALLQWVAVPLIPVVGGLVVAVLTKLVTFLHAKEGNSKVAGAFAIAVDFVETAFVHLRAGLEADLKLALADGTIDAAERASLVSKLVSLLKAELPTGVMSILGGALGPAFETWLSGKAGQVIDNATGAPVPK